MRHAYHGDHAPEKILVIPNGVNLDRFKPQNSIAPCRIQGLPDDSRPLLIVGRLSEEKGVIAAVEALLPLVGATAGLHLLILGDGEERQRLERLVKHAGMTDRVVF